MLIQLKNQGIKLGFKYLWKYQKSFLKVIGISIFGGILVSVTPLLLGKMVKIAGDTSLPIMLMVKLGIAWLLLDQIYNWTTRYVDKNGAFVAWDASSDLFIDSMQHLIRLPMPFLENQRLGKIMQRLDRSAEYLERNIRDVVFSLLPHFLTGTICLCVTFYLHWILGLLMLVIVTLYMYTMTSSTKRILMMTREARKMWEECWGYFWDIVNNIRAVKSNTNEDFESLRIKEAYNKPYDKEKEIEIMRTKLKAKEHLIFGIGAVVSLSTSAYLLRIGSINAGAMVSFVFYMSLIYKPFSQLAHNWRLVQESTIALERTAKFQELEAEDYDSGQSQPMTGNITFEDVSFSFKLGANGGDCDVSVFENINLEVKAGETIALVGESGVGKTTLVNLISKYFETTSGRILVDGINVNDWNLVSLRSQIAHVSQDVVLFNDTVKMNIAYGDITKLEEPVAIELAAHAANAHDFILSEKFKDGYNQVVGERGVKVSTGQRQRLSIARALTRNDKIKILIFDEITSALDSESEKRIQESLVELKKGKTTFIIAHRLSTIKAADRIVVLDKGRIAEIGTHQELLNIKDGVYRKMVELQSLQGEISLEEN